MISLDKIGRGLERLTSDLDKDGIKALLKVLLKSLSEYEEEFVKLSDVRSIDGSEGVWLDYLGEIFGVSRGGLMDINYREKIRFTISKNTSNATRNTILSLVKEFTNSVEVYIAEEGVAFATLYLDGDKNISKELYELVQSIKACGTRFIIHSDIFKNSFRLAYEETLPALESLAVTLDGLTFENLFVTLDGVNFEPLFINLGTELTYYPKSLVEGRNSFYYEEPPFLQITLDGINWEPLYLETPLPEKRLRVVTPYLEDYLPDNILPLTWEVWKNSKDALPLV
ncbi:TPA: hypothetical protein ACOAY7_002773 [Vibrio cholerae]